MMTTKENVPPMPQEAAARITFSIENPERANVKLIRRAWATFRRANAEPLLNLHCDFDLKIKQEGEHITIIGVHLASKGEPIIGEYQIVGTNVRRLRQLEVIGEGEGAAFTCPECGMSLSVCYADNCVGD